MHKSILFLTFLLSSLFILPSSLSAAMAGPEGNGLVSENVAPKLNWKTWRSASYRQKTQQAKAIGKSFIARQKQKPLLARTLRYALILAVVAIVAGFAASYAGNVSTLLANVLSTVGGVSALGALIFFILFLLENL